MGHLESISHSKAINFGSSSFHILCILAFIVFCFNQPSSNKPITHRVGLGLTSNYTSLKITEPTDCSSGLNQHKGFQNQCEFLKANPQCDEDGFFYYLEFFYCDCQNYIILGYIILVIWLAALFYLLGNTSADYFCCCLEKLSNVLRLPPTVAGVTLLPLGNGAPDVFSSIAAFIGTDNGDVGLNSISGGAVFVICVVVGTISLFVADQNVTIDRKCFVRDVSAFLFAIISLGVILFVGEVNVGSAIAFVSIYVLYATFVAATEILRKKNPTFKVDEYEPLLPLATTGPEIKDFRPIEDVPHLMESKVPHWMWGTTVAIYSDIPKPIWGWIDGETPNRNSGFSFWCSKLFTWLEFPLMLSRRLTIPIIEEERWSKGYAVASVTLAPLLVAFVWNSHQDSGGGQLSENLIYIGGAVLGSVFGVAAFIWTKCDHPPQKMLLPWVLGGFFMSIIWFCLVADELVALLVAFGYICRVNPSILGLTVLAWGNSMGDLMSNVALALNNGADGVQIAISGCYAGPMFNTLVGLGISMLIGSWSKRPDAYIMSTDSGLFCNLGFIVIGLVWSLIVLPKNKMQPNKLLGIGLIGIYCVFLCLRIGMATVNGTLTL